MMSATRLTEPEKKELDWESRREKWRLEFQQLLRNIISESGGEVAEGKESSHVDKEDQQVEIQWPKLEARLEAHCRRMDAKFDALKKAILDLSLPSEGRSMATTDANSGSYYSTDFKQLECNLSPVQKTEELELPHDEGPRSYNVESHERGWDVQRSTAATNEHVREGEVRLDPSEFMPLSHNLKPTEVNGIDSKSHVLNFSHNSAYYSVRNSARVLDHSKIDNGLVEQLSGVVEEESIMLGKDVVANSDKEFGNYWNFSLQFCLDTKAGGGKIDRGKVRKGRELEQNKLKGTERLSHARENAPTREFAVVLPISTCYSLSLSWLLNWFPRPTVKLKFMAQCDDELYEGFDDRSKGFLGRGEFSISEARGHSGIQWENESTLVEMQPDQRSGEQRHGLFDGVFPLSVFACNVFGVSMGLKSSSFCDAFRCASRNRMNLVDGFMESSNLRGQEVIGLKVSVRKWKNLSDREKLGNKRCGSKFGTKVDNLGFLAKLRGLGDNCWEVVDLVKESKEVPEGVSAVVFYESGVESSKWWSLYERMTRSLVFDHWENIKENEDFCLFALLFSQQESLFSVANSDSVRLEEGRSSAIPLSSLHNAVVCSCALECNRFECIKRLEVEVVWGLLIRFPKPMVKMKLMVPTVDGLGSATYSDKITPSRLKLKMVDLIIIASTQTHDDSNNEQWLDGSFQESAENYTIDIAALAVGTLSKWLCFWTTKALGYFSKCLGSNGHAAIILSMVDPMKEVMGCNSKGLRKWSGVQNHYLSLEWLLIWFPKPWVKMRLEKDYSGAYGNSNVEAVDILLRDREANLNLQLEYATAWMQNQLVAQWFVHWVHSSLAGATWEFSEEIKVVCFPGFIEDDEA